MIIIFEGVDKSGKSTLINHFNGLIIKNRIIPTNKTYIPIYQKSQSALLNFLKNHDKEKYNILLDRSYISEIVYSKVKRNYDAFDDIFYEFLSNEYRKMNCFVVYCYAPIVSLWERISEKYDFKDVKNIDELKLARERYNKFFSSEKLRISKVDLNTWNSKQACVQKIRLVMKHFENVI
ncbi:MAG: hypothetical protein ACFFDN_02700 [Candidatus Hodarchaeota archaeon]